MKNSEVKHIADQEEVFTKYSIPRVLAKFIVSAALSQLTFLFLIWLMRFLLVVQMTRN